MPTPPAPAPSLPPPLAPSSAPFPRKALPGLVMLGGLLGYGLGLDPLAVLALLVGGAVWAHRQDSTPVPMPESDLARAARELREERATAPGPDVASVTATPSPRG